MKENSKPALPTLQESWESYRVKCVPSAAGEGQVKQTRMAFFGGFFSGYMSVSTVTGLAMVDGMTQEEAARYLEGWRDEIEAFKNEIKPKTERN